MYGREISPTPRSHTHTHIHTHTHTHAHIHTCTHVTTITANPPKIACIGPLQT